MAEYARRRLYFNPRSPRGERRVLRVLFSAVKRISIHAPREGSDDWRRTEYFWSCISIHAPREGSDSNTFTP